jgi:hypothetical protein
MMSLFTQQISEALAIQEETKTLLKEGRINTEEADHRVANARQIILFARAAIEFEKRKVRQIRSQRTSQCRH